jgi:hypothetical protein
MFTAVLVTLSIILCCTAGKAALKKALRQYIKKQRKT